MEKYVVEHFIEVDGEKSEDLVERICLMLDGESESSLKDIFNLALYYTGVKAGELDVDIKLSEILKGGVK